MGFPSDEIGEMLSHYDNSTYMDKELPAIEQAATVRFSGAYDGGYNAASEKLGQWMEQEGYVFAGLLRGFCIVGPDTGRNPENWMTELQAPVVNK